MELLWVQLFFYKKSNGKEPVKEQLECLPLEERANVFARLDGIKKYSFECSRVLFKKVHGKLWEIKYKYKNQHRLFYCMRDSSSIILLHYVKKKTQKIELKDRDKAEQRMMEVLEND